MLPRTVTCRPSSGRNLMPRCLLLEVNAADLGAIVFQSEVDVAGLGFAAVEISPWTRMSVKFLASGRGSFPVNSLTVKVLRSCNEVEGELLGHFESQ